MIFVSRLFFFDVWRPQIGIPIDGRWNDIYLLKATGYGENFSNWTILEIFGQKSASIGNIWIKISGISAHFGYCTSSAAHYDHFPHPRRRKRRKQKPRLPGQPRFYKSVLL
ncbi:hypothetical protein [Rhizobium sp. M1]|uniref:hypothetical protein n=1 Tax=Rhizobium sp. M1 TaxID=2035453 RepID=UPI001143014E|nr:hypothetical protein [Rhizobium sp. M1]